MLQAPSVLRSDRQVQGDVCLNGRQPNFKTRSFLHLIGLAAAFARTEPTNLVPLIWGDRCWQLRKEGCPSRAGQAQAGQSGQPALFGRTSLKSTHDWSESCGAAYSSESWSNLNFPYEETLLLAAIFFILWVLACRFWVRMLRSPASSSAEASNLYWKHMWSVGRAMCHWYHALSRPLVVQRGLQLSA